MIEPDNKGINGLLDLFKEIQNMDGKKIQETIFPMYSAISKTPKIAKERADYEKFLKCNEILENKINIISEHFLGDMIKKHLG